MSSESLPFACPVSRFTTRESEATTLFDELRKPLLRYLVCLGLSLDEAQDVVQDAFLKLHQQVGRVLKENARRWLFRVAHNEARNRQKSHHRRRTAPLHEAGDAVLDQASPERLVLEKEKLRQLTLAVRSLCDSERDCLLLRAEGLRYREIAEVLGMSVSTVADTVARAVKRLAEQCHV